MRRFKDWPPWMRKAMTYTLWLLFTLGLLSCLNELLSSRTV